MRRIEGSSAADGFSPASISFLKESCDDSGAAFPVKYLKNIF